MAMTRRLHIGTLLALLALAPATAAPPVQATLYKSPQCGCCEAYADYLRRNGLAVTVKDTDRLAEISRAAGVPAEMQGCHTMFVEGYVVDGHVPVGVIRKLLAERPAIAGIVLPGMPDGSPGMSGTKAEPFVIYAVARNGTAPAVYARE